MNTNLATVQNSELAIDQNTISVLRDTLYPGAKDASIEMVVNYCKARKLNPLLKPVHLVPMSVKSGRKDSQGKDIYEWRDVVMPGIGQYRIDAARSGQYAGMSEPEFGEDVTEKVGSITITYPKWCKVTVKKLVNGMVCDFTAKEYWKENYATKSKQEATPNATWEKRSYGQLAKCAEAQALRKAFPDVVGQEHTKEEMEGKHFKKDFSNQVIEGEKISPMEIHDVGQDIMDISWAQNENELRMTFQESYKYWIATGDKESIAKIIAAKDKRKADLEENGENVDPETGEVSE